MQRDPNLCLRIKLTDHVLIREKEIETKAIAPDVSQSNIDGIMPFFQNEQPCEDEHFITQLKKPGLCDHFLAKQPGDDSYLDITGFLSLTPIPQVNLIGTNDFEDILTDLPNRTRTLDLFHEKHDDEVIREVLSWKNGAIRTIHETFL